MQHKITIRNMINDDCEIISKAFVAQGWNKQISLYEAYFQEQLKGERDVMIAECNGAFAGYITIQWESEYGYFRENNIPEIKDFNVLISYRRNGIGTKLMDEAELRISKKSNHAGLGVGLYEGYGNAQKLYVKRGYIPDGRGITYDNKSLTYGNQVVLDDDLCLMFTKKIG
jgi:ribosomal protein S18 acetylase RimI-like enzyme